MTAQLIDGRAAAQQVPEDIVKVVFEVVADVDTAAAMQHGQGD